MPLAFRCRVWNMRPSTTVSITFMLPLFTLPTCTTLPAGRAPLALHANLPCSTTPTTPTPLHPLAAAFSETSVSGRTVFRAAHAACMLTVVHAARSPTVFHDAHAAHAALPASCCFRRDKRLGLTSHRCFITEHCGHTGPRLLLPKVSVAHSFGWGISAFADASLRDFDVGCPAHALSPGSLEPVAAPRRPSRWRWRAVSPNLRNA